METSFTVGDAANDIAARKGRMVPTWRVRRIVDAMDVEIPRAGMYRLIPISLIPRIEAELERIWGREATPTGEHAAIIQR